MEVTSRSDGKPLSDSSAESASHHREGQVAPAAASRGSSSERLREGRMENINYLALAVCLALSNAWFVLSVMRFT